MIASNLERPHAGPHPDAGKSRPTFKLAGRKCCPRSISRRPRIPADKHCHSKPDLFVLPQHLVSRAAGCCVVHEVISTPSHRHQSPCHLTLNRAGEQPTAISRAICGPEPQGIRRCLEFNAKRQSGSRLHVRRSSTPPGNQKEAGVGLPYSPPCQSLTCLMLSAT